MMRESKNMWKHLLAGLFTFGIVMTTSVQTSLAASNELNLQLAVISDTHIDTKLKFPKLSDKLKNALTDLNEVAPNYDVIAINGDMTNNGLTDEYDLFQTIFQANKNPNAEEFITIGNHEWLESDNNPSVTDAQLKERFLSKMNVPNLYYDKWIKGYHFITIAGEKSRSTMQAEYGSSEKDSAYISNEQFQWLEKTLKEDSDSNKPIFVFFHQPITNTVYGSEWGAGLEDQKLLALLKKYPRVILFSGHSHYPLNNPESIVQDGITMVNTSAVAYTYTPEDQENYKQSQGYVVNVYDDRVELKAREFSDGTWIRTVTIPIPKKTTETSVPKVSSRDHWYYNVLFNIFPNGSFLRKFLLG